MAGIGSLVHIASSLVVRHVSGSRAKLGKALDDLVDGVDEIFLCGHLAACSDGVHASLSANRADLSTSAVGAEASQELVADAAFY